MQCRLSCGTESCAAGLWGSASVRNGTVRACSHPCLCPGHAGTHHRVHAVARIGTSRRPSRRALRGCSDACVHPQCAPRVWARLHCARDKPWWSCQQPQSCLEHALHLRRTTVTACGSALVERPAMAWCSAWQAAPPRHRRMHAAGNPVCCCAPDACRAWCARALHMRRPCAHTYTAHATARAFHHTPRARRATPSCA